MKSFSYLFFCYRTDNGSTTPIVKEENRVCGYKYGRRPRRGIGYSGSVGRMRWRPDLSVISEDSVFHAPVNGCGPARDVWLVKEPSIVNEDKAMAKSSSVNTRNLYSWRSLLENSRMASPSPFMF